MSRQHATDGPHRAPLALIGAGLAAQVVGVSTQGLWHGLLAGRHGGLLTEDRTFLVDHTISNAGVVCMIVGSVLLLRRQPRTAGAWPAAAGTAVETAGALLDAYAHLRGGENPGRVRPDRRRLPAGRRRHGHRVALSSTPRRRRPVMIETMADWGAGRYEATAAELRPVAELVVQQAAPTASEVVVDVACGTGNAALLAARRGAHVIGVDGAPRLLSVARERAQADGVGFDGREGDLLDLPVEDHSADVVLSVFGVIFASDPARALAEIARVLRPGGRVLLTAWLPAGPIDAMLAALGRVRGRAGLGRPEPPFAWHDPALVGRLAAAAGLDLVATGDAALAIRAASPEAYWETGQQHPMAVAARPDMERAGIDEDELREAMTAPLREANEDPDAFLVHSPYVVHELRPGGSIG